MFTFTTLTLLLATSAHAMPIWSRFIARQNAPSPAQLSQGTNFFFDSLHLEDQCTSGQIACISSNLAKCSPEGNWEISPCTGNTTCLAVPSSDNGVFVQCMLFTDAQAAIGQDSVSVDQGITTAPMNTATAAAQPAPTASQSSSSAPTASESASESSSSSASGSPTPTESQDPSSTCTDEQPEATETETITVILMPNLTESGVFVTVTLPGDETLPTDGPEDPESATVTGTDAGASPTSTDAAAEPTCTETPEDPAETAEPTDETSTEGGEPTESSSEGAEPTTESASAPESTPTDSGVTLTIAPGNQAPSPSATTSVPEVIVGGTHFIPLPQSSSAPAKMRRMLRSN